MGGWGTGMHSCTSRPLCGTPVYKRELCEQSSLISPDYEAQTMSVSSIWHRGSKSCSFSSFHESHFLFLQGPGSEPACCWCRNCMCERLRLEVWVCGRCDSVFHKMLQFAHAEEGHTREIRRQWKWYSLHLQRYRVAWKARDQCNPWPADILEHSFSPASPVFCNPEKQVPTAEKKKNVLIKQQISAKTFLTLGHDFLLTSRWKKSLQSKKSCTLSPSCPAKSKLTQRKPKTKHCCRYDDMLDFYSFIYMNCWELQRVWKWW